MPVRNVWRGVMCVMASEIFFWLIGLAVGLGYFGYYALCRIADSRLKMGVKIGRGHVPSVCLVIPTYNEADSIGGKLRNTRSIRYPRGRLSVIVIDSASKDGTANIVRGFMRKNMKDDQERKLRISFIREKKRMGKAHALNVAFRMCKGADVVAMTDSDCRLPTDILLKSMPYFADRSVGAITGRERIINPDENSATRSESRYRDFYYLIRSAESKMGSTYVFDGPFAAFRRKLVGRLRPDTVADDTELALMVRKKGYRTLSVPEAVYMEYAPDKLADRTKQKSRRAAGLNRSLLRHVGDFLFNPRHGTFGMFIYPMGIFMHILTPFLLAAEVVAFLFIPLWQSAALAAVAAVVMVVPRTRHIGVAFLHSQLANMIGVMKAVTPNTEHVWEKIEGTRRYGRN